MSYLGSEMSTFAINFSRPGSQILLQYYLFLRLSFEGYLKMQQEVQDVALYLSAGIAKVGAFTLWNDGSDIPVFAWQLEPGHTDKWNLYHLSDRLRMKGGSFRRIQCLTTLPTLRCSASSSATG